MPVFTVPIHEHGDPSRPGPYPHRGGQAKTLAFRDRVTPEEFIAARDRSARGGFLSPLTPEDLAGAKLYLTKDGTIGGMLKPDGDMGNLFNNGGPKGAAAEVLLQMIADGGKTADCFDGYLPDLYANFGLVETGRMKFNREYAPPGWDYDKYDDPDVVFLAVAANVGTPDQIRERVYGPRANWTRRTPGSTYVDDYDAAQRTARAAADAHRRRGRDSAARATESFAGVGRPARRADSRSGASDRRPVS